MIIINQTANKTDRQEPIKKTYVIKFTEENYYKTVFFLDNLLLLYKYGILDNTDLPYEEFMQVYKSFHNNLSAQDQSGKELYSMHIPTEEERETEIKRFNALSGITTLRQ